MDNGRLLHDAWRLTWRHRFLWLLGLFAGGGGQVSLNVPSGGFPNGWPSGSRVDPELRRGLDEVGAWIVAHVGLLLAAAAVVVLLGIVLLVVHFIAKGAMIGALGRLAAGEAVTLGGAWALGRRLAWRYVRLWLLLLAVALGVGIVVATLVLVVAGVGQASPGLAVGLAALVGGFALLLLLPLAIGFSLTLAYAERAIALDNHGALDGVRAGYRLLRARLGASIVLWLITLVIGIGSGVVFGLAALVVALPFGVAAVAAYMSAGLSGTVIALGAVGLLTLVLVVWAVSAVVNTYTAAFWTLGYLGLTDRYPEFPVY
jgi:hypothetical protein